MNKIRIICVDREVYVSNVMHVAGSNLYIADRSLLSIINTIAEGENLCLNMTYQQFITTLNSYKDTLDADDVYMILDGSKVDSYVPFVSMDDESHSFYNSF